MKEFVEKLIGRLEELKSNKGFGGTIQQMYADYKIDKAISIVNQLAEEYGKDTNVTTNADFIRNMSDEELAEFMENFDKTGGCDTCSIRYQGKCNSISKCKDGYLGWLQSEVKGSE